MHTDGRPHYAGHTEPIDLIDASGMIEGFCAGNVIKYVARYRRKGGLEDLMKAKYYLGRLIIVVEGQQPAKGDMLAGGANTAGLDLAIDQALGVEDRARPSQQREHNED